MDTLFMPKEQEILIALGSNLGSEIGDSAATLKAALAALHRRGLALRRCSRIYKTPCFPAGAGPDYANACAVLHSAETPAGVLDLLHATEAEFGRQRITRWGSRTLDLDLLGIGEIVLPDATTQAAWRALDVAEQAQRAPAELILPHPRLQDRAFVLVPLCDVAAGWRHPLLGRSVAEMCAALPAADRAAVVPLQDAAP
jgi:2-amino-4-hydroxy-6-hydroxymethyldihydropteridine diphosphokinase